MNRRYFYFLIGVIPLFAFNGPEGEREALIGKLCKGWQYQKCRIMGVEYAPKPAEANDRFSFRQDMTFTMIEEGTKKEGTWKILDAAKGVLSLVFEEGVTKRLRIAELNDRRLVYDIMVDWEHSVTVYMTAAATKLHLPNFQTFHFSSQKESMSLQSLLFKP